MLTFAKLIDKARGRHTFFIVLFTIAGHVMAWFDKLTPTYIGFMSVVMSFVLGHSIKEDYFAKPDPDTTTTTTVATPNAVATQTKTTTPAPG